MISRRRWLLSATGAGAAAAAYGLYRDNHTIPPRDPAAEERFRRLQHALLAESGIAAESRFVGLASPPVRAHVLEAGQGEPVLFLHGGNSVAASWTPLLARLHRRFRCYAPDRPGCGLTDKFNYPGVDLRSHGVQFVRSVMDVLGLARAAVAGNSMGGYFALVFDLAHPERVSKLVFFERMLVADVRRASAGYLDCMAAAAVIPGAKASWITMIEQAFAPAGAGLLSGASTLTYALRPELGQLATPTLFLWGDKDTFGPPAWGQEMARLMPHARCEVIADAGHLPFVDQPEVCARLVESFLTAA